MIGMNSMISSLKNGSWRGISHAGISMNGIQGSDPDLGLPESARNLMRESFLPADYDRNFQVYFIRASSMLNGTRL